MTIAKLVTAFLVAAAIIWVGAGVGFLLGHGSPVTAIKCLAVAAFALLLELAWSAINSRSSE
jgi:hypothetical protein